MSLAASTVDMCRVRSPLSFRQVAPYSRLIRAYSEASAGVSGSGSVARSSSVCSVSPHFSGVLSPTPRGSIPTMSK